MRLDKSIEPNNKLDAETVALEAAELLKYFKNKGSPPQLIMTVCQTAASTIQNILSTESLMIHVLNILSGKGK